MKENRAEYVRKRDGSIVPFNKQKIADAIFKAAQSVGGQDRYLSEDLAEVVKIYLEKEYKGDIPSVEEIQDIVERILIKTGHAKTAKAYILYRQKRARARQIREGRRPESLSEEEVLKDMVKRDVVLSVRRSDDRIGIWDKGIIVDALVKETGLSRNIAELIVAEVEEDVIVSKVKNLTSSMIRELVNAKLIQYGFEDERLKHSRIGLPLYDISSILDNFDGSPDELSLYLGRRMKREFAMNTIIPQALVEKHIRGEVSIKNIECLDKILTAHIPVRTVEEIDDLYQRIAPLVDEDVVFSLPDDISDNITLDKSPFSVELPYQLIGKIQMKIGTPFIVRVEKLDDLEALMRGKGKNEWSVSIHQKGAPPLFVLNRVILNMPVINAYAEQDGTSPEKYLSEIMDLLVEMVASQEALILKMPYGSRCLSLYTGYHHTLEIACGETDKNRWLPDENFVLSALSRSLSVSMRTTSDYLIEIAKNCFEKQDIIVRIVDG